MQGVRILSLSLRYCVVSTGDERSRRWALVNPILIVWAGELEGLDYDFFSSWVLLNRVLRMKDVLQSHSNVKGIRI